MSIVVGYVPTKEGRAALRRAAEEALLRKTKLDRDQLQPRRQGLRRDEARRFEAELAARPGPARRGRRRASRCASWSAATSRPRT